MAKCRFFIKGLGTFQNFFVYHSTLNGLTLAYKTIKTFVLGAWDLENVQEFLQKIQTALTLSNTRISQKFQQIINPGTLEHHLNFKIIVGDNLKTSDSGGI